MHEQLEGRVLFAFTPAVYYHTGSESSGVAVADFNGDGKSDLAVTHAATGAVSGVSCLLGTSAAKFTAAPGATVGLLAFQVASADFNGDHRLDIATTYRVGFSVAKGLGKGKFAPHRDYPMGEVGIAEVEGIVATDLNHDGHPDIAVTDVDGVKVSLNGGAGTFHSPRLYESLHFEGRRSIAGRLATADFNGDGFPDLVSGGLQNALTVYFNRGDGNFSNQVVLSTLGNREVHALVVGDFNRDHKTDVAVACSVAQCICIFQSNGDQTFKKATVVPFVDGADSPPGEMAAGDFNGDHRLDLAVTGASDQVRILDGRGNGAFRNGRAITLDEASNVTAAGDLNGDGKTDLVISQFSDEMIAIVLM
jgi:hypothetical protein